MDRNLLKIGTILRPHGIKGAVKVESLVDEGFDGINNVMLGEKLLPANIVSKTNLNKDFYILTLSCITNIDEAEKYRNVSIYIDRSKYPAFKEKLYMSDIMNKPLLTPDGKVLGTVIDFDDYGASTVLTVKCGAVSYQIPYVVDIVKYDADRDGFIIDEKVFEDLRI